MNAPLPLQGLGVLITRPRAAGEALAAALAREGARPFVFPALEIAALDRTPEQDQALARLPESDLAIFVSANAVEHGLTVARRRGPWPARVRVAAIGEATARALAAAGFDDVIAPRERFDSEALLAEDALADMSARGVVIFRGAGGREALKAALESRGARVTYVECYRRVRPASDTTAVLDALERGEIHAVSVLSAETLENVVDMLGPEARPRLARTALLVPHASIAAHPLARRFDRVVVTGAGAEGLAQALAASRVSR